MALFDNLSLYQGDDFSQEILYLEQVKLLGWFNDG
jgi:hypothetical protein